MSTYFDLCNAILDQISCLKTAMHRVAKYTLSQAVLYRRMSWASFVKLCLVLHDNSHLFQGIELLRVFSTDLCQISQTPLSRKHVVIQDTSSIVCNQVATETTKLMVVSLVFNFFPIKVNLDFFLSSVYCIVTWNPWNWFASSSTDFIDLHERQYCTRIMNRENKFEKLWCGSRYQLLHYSYCERGFRARKSENERRERVWI